MESRRSCSSQSRSCQYSIMSQKGKILHGTQLEDICQNLFLTNLTKPKTYGILEHEVVPQSSIVVVVVAKKKKKRRRRRKEEEEEDEEEDEEEGDEEFEISKSSVEVDPSFSAPTPCVACTKSRFWRRASPQYCSFTWVYYNIQVGVPSKICFGSVTLAPNRLTGSDSHRTQPVNYGLFFTRIKAVAYRPKVKSILLRVWTPSPSVG